MTEAQAARVNAALGERRDWKVWLSPRQLEVYRSIETQPKAGWKPAIGTADLIGAWRDVRKRAALTPRAKTPMPASHD